MSWTDIYVQVSLQIHTQVVKTKWTPVIRGSNPTFNERLTFKLVPLQLDAACLSLEVQQVAHEELAEVPSTRNKSPSKSWCHFKQINNITIRTWSKLHALSHCSSSNYSELGKRLTLLIPLSIHTSMGKILTLDLMTLNECCINYMYLSFKYYSR